MESALTENEQKKWKKSLSKNKYHKKKNNTKKKTRPNEEVESPSKLRKREEKTPKVKIICKNNTQSGVFVLSKLQRGKQRKAYARDSLSGSLPSHEDVVHPSGPWPGLVLIEYLHEEKRPKTMLKISLRKCETFGLFSKCSYLTTRCNTPLGLQRLYKAVYQINGEDVGYGIGTELRSAQDSAANNAIEKLRGHCYTIRVKTPMGIKTGGIRTVTRAALGEDEKEMFAKAEEIIKTHFEGKSSLDDLLFSSEFGEKERNKLYRIAAKFNIQSKTQGPKDNFQVVMFRQMSSWKILQELLKGQVSSKYELIPPKIMQSQIM